MKQASRIALGALGILLFSCSAALAYWAVAPELIGPKAEMVQFCGLLKPGMQSATIDAALAQNSAVKATPDHEGERYVSQVKAGWMCTCGIELQEAPATAASGVRSGTGTGTGTGLQISAVKEVTCVD